MNPTIEQAQKEARSTIESNWKEIAKTYTLGWGGPIGAIELQLPHISQGIRDIRNRITPVLPIMVYQTRQSPPENTSIAVPYDPDYKCRIVSTNQLPNNERELLGRFAQSIWFLIHSEALPNPRAGKAFQNQLIELTDESLFRL
jgi:hypothetical protein